MLAGGIRAIVADMDGVLWRGEQPLPGLHEFFAMLRAREVPWALATNNSSRTQADYVRKLARMGVPAIPPARIVTSATATAAWLQRHRPPGTRVHVFGGDGLRATLRAAGFRIVEEKAEVVVAGLHRELNYDSLRRATTQIRAGASFIGTNPDTTFPDEQGIAPGAGSLLAALEAASGVAPLIIGKPHPPMFEAALALLGASAGNTLMIGDRLNTDVQGAAGVGMRTALVLGGITTEEELRASELQPELFCDSLAALVSLLSDIS